MSPKSLRETRAAKEIPVLPKITAENLLRVCLFRPYLRGEGPAFVLTMWATDKTDGRGQTWIAYRLTQVPIRDPGATCRILPTVIFQAADFCGSPMNADDSDETVAGLMGFLTLRPSDTDAEYFEAYTAKQLAFRDMYAEDLRAVRTKGRTGKSEEG